jgi:hypothetical protein
VLLLHDGNGARRAHGSGGPGDSGSPGDSGGPAVLETTRRLLDLFERRGLRAVPLPEPGIVLPDPLIEGGGGMV